MQTTVSHIAPSDSKTHALIAYALLFLGLFTAIPLLLGALWAMVNKRNAIGTVFHSHYVNATRIFWWSLFWTILGCLLLAAFVGVLILAAAWVWALYRLLNGFALIVSDQPYPFE